MAKIVKTPKHYHIRNAFNEYWGISGWTRKYPDRLVINENEKQNAPLPTGGFWQVENL